MTNSQRANEILKTLGLEPTINEYDYMIPGLLLILSELAKRIVALEKKHENL